MKKTAAGSTAKQGEQKDTIGKGIGSNEKEERKQEGKRNRQSKNQMTDDRR